MTVQPESSSSVTPEATEGRAKLILPSQATSGRTGVFYNPKMSLNRDLAILFASSYFPLWRRLRVCDPMTGSGVRAVRYAIELSNVTSVVAADNRPETVEAAQRTIQLNGLGAKITAVESDANLLLLNHLRERFDLIDLDPFGSPAPFFESAARATIDSGVIAATATDMGPLTGARAAACARKYGVRPIRTEFEKEMAIRVIASCLAAIAGRLELGINVVFSHASDHYARIYAAITKGKPSANFSAKSLGFIEYCPGCLRRDARNSLETIRTTCEDCGTKTKLGGPVWLGRLWDAATVQRMIGRTPELGSSRLSEIQQILGCIDEELDAPPFHYRTDAISGRLRMKPAGMNRVLNALHEAGYQAARTHFHSNGFRTDASCREIASILRTLTKEA